MKLNDGTFFLYAAKCYDNPQCSTVEEFEEDLRKFFYLKKLFGRYHRNGDLQERLILNHIIVLYNVFGHYCTNMLFHQLSEYSSYLKPFIIQLGFLKENQIIEYNDVRIIESDIGLDSNIVDKLRTL